MDWSTLPEELLTVEVYAVDGSGHHPRIYLGYYNNKPMNLLGVTDERGYDFSGWMNSKILQKCYDMGFSSADIYIGFNDVGALDLISGSYFSFVHSHGVALNGFLCNANGNFSCVTSNMVSNDSTRDYSSTVALVLLGCKMGDGGSQNQNNLVNTFHNKGIQVVLGFKKKIFGYHNVFTKKYNSTNGSGLWGKTFIELLAKGKTVEFAAQEATETVERKNKNKTSHGLNSIYIAGNGNTVIKH